MPDKPNDSKLMAMLERRGIVRKADSDEEIDETGSDGENARPEGDIRAILGQTDDDAPKVTPAPRQPVPGMMNPVMPGSQTLSAKPPEPAQTQSAKPPEAAPSAPQSAAPQSAGSSENVSPQAARPAAFPAQPVRSQPAAVTQPAVATRPEAATRPEVATQPAVATRPEVATRPGVATRPEVAVQSAAANRPEVTAQASAATRPGITGASGQVPSPSAAPVKDGGSIGGDPFDIPNVSGASTLPFTADRPAEIRPENYTDRYLEVEELYDALSIKSRRTDSIYLVEEYLRTLPDSLPDESRREIVIKIVAASGFDFDRLMGDGVLRVKMLKEYAERFAQYTEDYVNARNSELDELEQQILKIRTLIEGRRELHKRQFFTIEAEAQRLKEILTFISG